MYCKKNPLVIDVLLRLVDLNISSLPVCLPFILNELKMIIKIYLLKYVGVWDRIWMRSTISWLPMFYDKIFSRPHDWSRYIPSVQYLPFHPGWHPRSQTPELLLQLLQLAVHSRKQFSPKYPSWHSTKEKKTRER